MVKKIQIQKPKRVKKIEESKKKVKMIQKKRKQEEKAKPVKKQMNIVNLKDIKIKKIVTVKKIRNQLYAYVKYADKKTQRGKKHISFGFLKTSDFVTPKSKALIEFLESKMEFEKCYKED